MCVQGLLPEDTKLYFFLGDIAEWMTCNRLILNSAKQSFSGMWLHVACISSIAAIWLTVTSLQLTVLELLEPTSMPVWKCRHTSVASSVFHFIDCYVSALSGNRCRHQRLCSLSIVSWCRGSTVAIGWWLNYMSAGYNGFNPLQTAQHDLSVNKERMIMWPIYCATNCNDCVSLKECSISAVCQCSKC